MQIQNIKIIANNHPLILDADHPQPLAVDDAIAAPVTTPSCRTQRLPLDVDDAIAAPVTTRSCRTQPRAATTRRQHHAANHLALISSALHGGRRATASLDLRALIPNVGAAKGSPSSSSRGVSHSSDGNGDTRFWCRLSHTAQAFLPSLFSLSQSKHDLHLLNIHGHRHGRMPHPH